MSEQTFIIGKDEALEISIETMQQKLKDLNFDIEEASWLNPVPNVYSVHIRDKDCGLMFTNGKGATAKACLASALGEYFERLSCNYFFADFYLGENFAQGGFVHYPDEKWFPIETDAIPEGIMDESLWNYYDAERVLKPQNIIDTNSGVGERGICSVPYARQRDNKTVYIPVNIIGNLYVSNGMSAGNTQNEARVQSLSEIFERYVKNKIIAEGLCLPEIPEDVIAKYPGIKKSMDELALHGYHLRVADASLGGKYPVISVTLINPKDGAVFASFGAHPCFEVAFERTVTELLQGRSLDQLDGFQSPSFDLDECADHHNLETHFIDSSGLISYDFFKNKPDYAFVDWNHNSTTEDEFTYCCELIHDMNFDIYISDYNHLNVYACRIIVPGMSDIYPVDDLEWSNNNEGALFREDILSLKNLDKNQWQNILQRLDEGGYNDVQRVAEFIGIAPDANTPWASLRIGELKAMLCLAIEDFEQAMEWNDWCLHMDQLNDERNRFYRSLQALLEIKLDDSREYVDYVDSLNLMYGHKTIAIGIKLLGGDEKFYGLHSPGLSLDGFNTHKKLLQGYAKLQKAKSENWSTD
ncbi:Ribosomal protein S12p methylthiotransferase accessory factor YcaO [hydrothermal vent metagenome]|uniref:Ribosomal protein S12p methylthiotransferase accessory factor YcaO n=1 Tax=hydrothermal vent metagenome TaxID=652676 RepID=A0A3B0X3Z9_9ZZZZ